MPRLKRPSHKMLTFARRIIAGDDPLAALESSEYRTADWGSDANKRSYAHRLMGHPLIADAVADAQALEFGDAVASRQEVLEQLTVVARGSLAGLIEFRTVEIIDADGKRHTQAIWAVRDSDRMTPDQLDLIEELTATPTGGFRIKLRSAADARRQLARLQGWDAAPRVPVDQNGDIPQPILSITRTALPPPAGSSDYKRA